MSGNLAAEGRGAGVHVSPLYVLRAVGRMSREVARRTREHGLHAGWNCVRAHLINFHIRVRNRFCRKPRVECPCCGWKGYAFRILDVGHWIVWQVECPACGNHDRHRMLHIVLERAALTIFKPGNRVLHFAPEPMIQHALKQRPGLRPRATDLQPGALTSAEMPRFASDMMHMPVRDNALDALITIHVLEHVPDDRRALAELHRILKPGGTAMIMVPFAPVPRSVDWDKPNPLIYNHMRDYSINDFEERLAGFDVRAITPADLLTPEERTRYWIQDNQVIYLCTK